MAFRFPDPPEWWLKYKPLRWVLAVLVVYWVFGTLLPRWREEAALPDVPSEVTTTEAEPAPPVEETTPPSPEPVPTAEAPPVEPAPPPQATTAATPPKAAVPPPPKPAAATAPASAPAPTQPVPSAGPGPQTEPDLMARYTQVETERVQFMNTLRSYDSVASIRTALIDAGYKTDFSVIERKRRSDRDPPFRNDTLNVQEFRHGEFAGRLRLEFFNDRLFQAEFVPAEPAGYLAWLRSRGLKLPVKRVGLTTMTTGYLRVGSNIDFASSDVGRTMGSEPFVRWEDTRLTQQFQDAR
jgi:hypothetical protein